MSKKILRLTETSIMIALATVLSMIKFYEMPYGGSITAFSLVPLIIIAYRYGVVWGLSSSFVFSLIQLLLGQSNLSYATSAVAVIAIILLDYIFAFSFVGLSGVFRKAVKNPAVAATLGALLVCIIRYVSHVISGCTVWAGISIPTAQALYYSVGYNATYMIIETIVNVVMTFWIFSLLDFRTKNISRLNRQEKSASTAILASLSMLSVAVVIIIDSILILGQIQDADGNFVITRVALANYGAVEKVTLIGLAVFAFLFIASMITNLESKILSLEKKIVSLKSEDKG